MRIDAHHHVWDLAVRDQPWTAGLPALRRSFAFGEIRDSLTAHNIDASVIVQTVAAPEETLELLALATTEPKVAAVVGWVDLTAPDVSDQLARLRSAHGGAALVGVRHGVQDEVDPTWLSRPEVRRGLASVQDAGLAYDLLVNASQLDAAIQLAGDMPELRLVLDHGGKPQIESGATALWMHQIAELAGFEQVAEKLSGLVTEAGWASWSVEQLRPIADALLTSFGASRVMYGSDWPVCLLAATYDQVIESAELLVGELSPTEQSAVFGSTAQRWYGLDQALTSDHGGS